MFNFIVKYFSFLKHIPLLPHLYDALLKIQLFFTNRQLLDSLDTLEDAVCEWKNVSVAPHKYGGTQFNVNGFELGHLHGNGLLDVQLNRSMKKELMAHTSVLDHHVFKNSGWISLWIKDSSDCELALSVLSKAYAFRTVVR